MYAVAGVELKAVGCTYASQKYEGTIKTGQAELHALQKQQMSLQQRVQEGPRNQQQLEGAKRE